jgi:phosphate starvation-inducible PhoH-like protein
MAGQNRVRQQERKSRNSNLEYVSLTHDRKNTRKTKSDVCRDTTPLKPMNDRQKDYIQAIKQNPVVICTGVWGSSKTYIPSVIACDMLLAKEIDMIVIARPNEGKGKTVGFLKGDLDQKMSVWTAPVTDTMKKRLGLGNFEAFVGNEKIVQLSLEHVKGRSWDRAFIIVDEAEDLDPDVAKSLVGRQGVHSKIVITGDIRQKDLKKNSGLEFPQMIAEKYELPIPIIDFDDWEYCVRSEEAKMWGIAFEEYENGTKT